MIEDLEAALEQLREIAEDMSEVEPGREKEDSDG
jgi:hypothetical protein